MSENCDNDILLSDENLEFIDDEENDNFSEKITKKILIKIYKLKKEIYIFIFKTCSHLCISIKTQINENY